jgi:hypothetical protein
VIASSAPPASTGTAGSESQTPGTDAQGLRLGGWGDGQCRELSDAYMRTFKQHFITNFYPPRHLHTLYLVFAFSAKGKILRLELLRSSGSKEFDLYVMQHFHVIEPMPAIPASEHVQFFQDILAIGDVRDRWVDDHCHPDSPFRNLPEGNH